MEALAGLGAFSAIATIVVEFDHVRRRAKRCAKTLKHAKEEFEEIAEEIGIFIETLDLFCFVARSQFQRGLDSSVRIKTSKLGDKIAEAGNRSVKKVYLLLDSANDLRSSSESTRLKYWKARWRWRTQREDIWPILKYMNSVKLSANLLICIIQLDIQLNEARIGRCTLSNEQKEQM
jgi:hypothetical protein